LLASFVCKMFSVSSDAIGSFKTGDNINHNLRILVLLYKYYDDAIPYDQNLLRKPIILLLVTIVEAVLHDFHARIVHNVSEGVSNLTDEVIAYIRGKKIDELEKYIVSARRHDFFDAGHTNFYDALDQLRKVRNRVHIQNIRVELESSDYHVFTERRKIMAEKAVELVLKTMAKKYGRGASRYVKDFELPWSEYFAI